MLFFVYAFFLFAPPVTLAMSNATFQDLMSQIRAKKYSAVEKFLTTKREELKEDPEYFVLLLNFVLSKGDKSGIIVAKGNPNAGDLPLSSKDGKIVGFIGEREQYYEKLILDGISRTESSLKYFKSRLDIRFGIVTASEQITRWDILGRQLVDMLKTSREINNQWLWGPVNSMDGDPKEFMIENILPRTASLFDIETKEADQAFMIISEALVEYYPDLPYGYSNLGVLYLAKKDLVRAENYLKQAEKISPNDEVIQHNLAKLKQMKGR